MNFNDYQNKGFDTSFHYAQDYSTTPRKTTGYPAIGNPAIYPGRWQKNNPSPKTGEGQLRRRG